MNPGIPPKRFLALGLLTAAAYVASAKLGLTLAFVAQQVTVVWPPTGIALAAVLLVGYRSWPFTALGAFVANITRDRTLQAGFNEHLIKPVDFEVLERLLR